MTKTNTGNSHSLLRGACCAVASAVIAVAGSHTASAFTAGDATAAYNAWWSNFNSSSIGWWTGAETIEMVEDRGVTADINTMCNKFTTANGTSWSSNSYNDDITWACIAFVRAYMATGNTTYRTIAKNNFDTMYARAWDTANNGGGLWWNTSAIYKSSCVNFPAVIAAHLLYLALGDSSYSTKAQTIFDWGKTHLYQSSTGKVYDGWNLSGTYNTDATSYNQGTFAGAAYYRGEGSTLGFASGDFVKNTWGVTMPVAGTTGDAAGFNGICLRWLAKLGYDSSYRQAIANQAWSRRDANNLVSCQWDRATSGTQNGWSCTNAVIALNTVAGDGDKVMFFQDSYYGGSVGRGLAEGTYTLAQLQALGISNDWASSVRVPYGWKVTIYSDNNFAGTTWTVTADTVQLSALSPSGGSDAMSSCKVEMTGALFYQDANYGGTYTQPIAKGTYTLAQLQALGFTNDWASSAKLPSGWTLIMYSDNNFAGTSWTVTSDTPLFSALTPTANDVVSSCKVQ